MCRDRKGLVKEMTSIIAKHKGNIESARNMEMAGIFTSMMLISVPKERVGDLRKELQALDQKPDFHHVYARRVIPVKKPVTQELASWIIELEGQDAPGIMDHITSLILGRNFNILSLDSENWFTPASTSKRFKIKLRVLAPMAQKQSNIDKLKEELYDVPNVTKVAIFIDFNIPDNRFEEDL